LEEPNTRLPQEKRGPTRYEEEWREKTKGKQREVDTDRCRGKVQGRVEREGEGKMARWTRTGAGRRWAMGGRAG